MNYGNYNTVNIRNNGLRNIQIIGEGKTKEECYMETMKKTITLMIVSAWLLVPTGTPDDVVAWFLINELGPVVYGALLVVMLLLMWHYKINLKKIKKTMKGLFKKVFK